MPSRGSAPTPAEVLADLDASGPIAALRRAIRDSSLPYVGSLVVTAMLAGYVNYLSPLVFPDGFTIKGQALSIIVALVGFPVTVILWALYRGGPTRSRWLVAYLLGLAAAWLIHMVLNLARGDQYTHPVWLFVPILVMLLLKTPSSREAWQAIVLVAWLATAILLVTRLLEITGVLKMFYIEQWIIEWEKERYWLPFSGYLGLEGRWPGPFGYNSKTGFVSVLLVLIGLARWTKSSVVFVVVGVLGILLTGGRGSLLSLLTGILVLVVFTRRNPLARVPLVIRMVGGLAVVGAALGAFFLSPLASTGRLGAGGIWESFLDLWRSSPWIGVGQNGIWSAGGRAGEAMEAHSLYLQELAEFGLVGFASQYVVIGIGLVVLCIAAYRGFAGPLALVAAFLAASMTEVFQDGWQRFSTYSLMATLSVIAAGAWVVELSKDAPAEVSAG